MSKGGNQLSGSLVDFSRDGCSRAKYEPQTTFPYLEKVAIEDPLNKF